RLSRIVIGYSYDDKPVTAGDIGAAGAMAALLKDAFDPNLVQTLEHTPALIHGGPFANIAHGCNSVMATKLAMKLGDYVVTEAGFGADLGAEKFLDIKCRMADIAPSAVVLVATVRALKHHGGCAKAELGIPNVDLLRKGSANLIRHIENMRDKFGMPVCVAINAFPTDSAEEHAYLRELCAEQNVPCALSDVFSKGGEGGIELANAVLNIIDERKIQYTYELNTSIEDKLNAVCTKIYGADAISFTSAAQKQLLELNANGFGSLPVCIAKTQYSFSDDAKLLSAPTGFTMTVRSLRLSAGAGFIVAVMGDIMTMPGLGKKPAAENIDIDANGVISGLF
ncbi:MAG: formate--tetrahydrofolate ligase, partial [Oscillospiraceae bacterium]